MIRYRHLMSPNLGGADNGCNQFYRQNFPRRGNHWSNPELEAEQPFITDEQEWMEEQSIPELLSDSGVELEPVSGIIEPLGEISEKVEEQPAADQLDEDKTFAWLEALAARQGADAEELLTQPDERRFLQMN
jgi:hypothetical protein